MQINFSLSLFKKFNSFRATYQSTYPDYFNRKSALANTNINFCALLSPALIFPMWCHHCTFSDQTLIFCHAPYKPHIIQFHFWLPSFKHIYPPVGLFFIYIFLLACEMIFLQDSCTQIRFHVCTVILLTVRLVSRITRSHISGTCCVHVHCDQKTKLTYYSIRGKKAEAYPHAYIYRYIYIYRERERAVSNREWSFK